MTAVTEPMLIEVRGGQLLAPANLSFELPAPPEGITYVAGTWDGSRWQPLAGKYSHGVFEFAAPHFSWWRVFGIDLGPLLNRTFETIFSVSDSSVLPCPTADQPLNDGYRAFVNDNTDRLSNADAVSGCGRVENGELITQLKNRHQGAISVEIPMAWSGVVDGASEFSTLITQGFLNLTNRKFLVVPGGATATITGTLQPGERHSLPIEQDMFSWSIDGLIEAAAIYALGAKANGDVDTVSTMIKNGSALTDTIAGELACLGTTAEFVKQAGTSGFDQAGAESLIPAIWKCSQVAQDSVTAGLGQLISVAWTPLKLLFSLYELGISAGKSRSLFVERIKPDLCSEAAIGYDLGHPVTLKDGLCKEGWAYIDNCAQGSDCLGDAQAVVRRVDGKWTTYTLFPNPTLCRSTVLADGAPLSIVDRIGWACASSPRPTAAYEQAVTRLLGELRAGTLRGAPISVAAFRYLLALPSIAAAKLNKCYPDPAEGPGVCFLDFPSSDGYRAVLFIDQTRAEPYFKDACMGSKTENCGIG